MFESRSVCISGLALRRILDSRFVLADKSWVLNRGPVHDSLWREILRRLGWR